MQLKVWTLLAIVLNFGFAPNQTCAQSEFDVVIYGGTSAAVTAAVQVKKMDRTVAIVCPEKHLGGLTSGGLGWTDSGNKAVIGGLSREFYHRIWKKYQEPKRWKQQSIDDFGKRSIDDGNQVMWVFEPHVAEEVFEDLIREFDIPVFRDHWLDRKSGVDLVDGRIRQIRTLNGTSFRGRIFIDATYEGDLLAAAGVSYHVGREGKDVYGEHWNGVQIGVLHHNHHFGQIDPVSPYVVPDDPSSGVLPRISTTPPGERHEGDHRVQAYCFRMCLTDDPNNRIPFPKPQEYDPSQYELLIRVYQAGFNGTFNKFDSMPNRKTDTNNHGPFSTDNIGFNYDYPDGSYKRRREIIAEHESYQKGWLYFIANDPRVPKDVQAEMNRWGLPKDEFVDNDHWPHQLYVREARRMIGDYVMTEHELLKTRPTPDSIGMGSYTIDSHNVQRYITPEGFVQNEGDIGVKTNGPYQIAAGSVLPQRDECTNLLVPVCVSSSHIAFGSIRMEPVFMILGQSAATIAVMSIESDVSVHDVPYDALRSRLVSDGQVLSYNGPVKSTKRESVAPETLEGTVIDDDDVDFVGNWQGSTSSSRYVGWGYRHDRNTEKGELKATFRTNLPASGRYEVRLAYQPNKNRATNAKVAVKHAGGVKQIVVNQRKPPPIDGLFLSLGTFRFDQAAPGIVTVSNEGTDGYVIVDAVQWLQEK